MNTENLEEAAGLIAEALVLIRATHPGIAVKLDAILETLDGAINYEEERLYNEEQRKHDGF